MSTDLIKINEDECTELLTRSGPVGQVLPLTYGVGWVALDPTEPTAAWAIAELAKLRETTAATQEDAVRLNTAVDTAVTDTLHEGLREAFSMQSSHQQLERVTNDLGYKITTAVFEAIKAAGFAAFRKG